MAMVLGEGKDAEGVQELLKTQELLLSKKPELLQSPELLQEHLLKEMQAHVQAQAQMGAGIGANLSAGAGATPPSAPTPPTGKRANRTRFTDYQIKVLQEFFESNAYPKDDDLECLSKLLNLSPRVIVVWFQNARQKARKVYENQPQTSEDESGRFQGTPGLNYQCKKCLQVFQRYYELIKHQRNSCFKDENPIALQLKSATQQDSSQPHSQPDRPESSVGSSHSPPGTPEPSVTPKSTASSGANLSSSATAERQHSQASTLAQSPLAPHSALPASIPAPTTGHGAGSFRCDKCPMVFPRFELWREHQIVHIMNPTLFPGTAVAGAQRPPLPMAPTQNPAFPGMLDEHVVGNQWKRKLDSASTDEECSPSKESASGDGSPRDKRLRTTILPEQLDFLYQKYQQESNPSREMLESIARDVGLKKRVVQVWFQNTRARERKGQFRAHQQAIHKRCPFCRALFKARSALESHLATRHADLYSKGELNIDAFPDGDADNSNPDDNASSAAEENKNNVEEFKRFLEELNGPTDLSAKRQGETPLDLSRPEELNAKSRTGPARAESDSEDTQDQTDVNMSENDSVVYYDQQTSPGSLEGRAPGANPGGAKRFRTQMTSLQLKAMKSIFQEYKTPTMAECDSLGNQVGLPKRVVQVWFQNARAKEKKAKSVALKLGQVVEPDPPRADHCELCGVRYESFSSSLQDHLFSPAHINQLRRQLELTKDDTNETSAPSGAAAQLQAANQNASSSYGNFEHGNFTADPSNLVQQLQLLNQLNMAQQHPSDAKPLDKGVDVANNNPPEDYSLFSGGNGPPPQFPFFGGQTPPAPLFTSGRQ